MECQNQNSVYSFTLGKYLDRLKDKHVLQDIRFLFIFRVYGDYQSKWITVQSTGLLAH